MAGVTTAIVLFIFFCVVYPERVKNRAQFYAALGIACAIILLDAISFALGASGFRVFTYFATAALQVGEILILFMAAGGLSWNDLKGEMGNAYEVIRRGGEEKEIIVPLSGEMARRPAGSPVPSKQPNIVQEPGVIRIDDASKSTDSSLPLE